MKGIAAYEYHQNKRWQQLKILAEKYGVAVEDVGAIEDVGEPKHLANPKAVRAMRQAKVISNAKDKAELPTLPFLLGPGQLQEGINRTTTMALNGMKPSELVYMPLEVIFTHPGWLKMHDKVILLGPVLKYLLQDFFGLQERKKLFE